MAQPTTTGKQHDALDQALDALMERADRLIATARPEAVFAEPVTAEGRTVIGAAEVLVAAGFGGGGAYGPQSGAQQEPEQAIAIDGGGMGAGVGGFAQSRPVAVIIIDQNGARVEPVVDVTKLGLAALTVIGSMFFFFGRLIRKAKKAG